jgi:hypothetical protein
MNLQAIAVGPISVVNPQLPLAIQISTGNTINPDGTVTPTYLPPIRGVSGQVQNLTYKDLVQLEGLNLQGLRRAIYINGLTQANVRVTQQGGDLVTTPDGNVWLVAQVLELWPDWCKVAVTLQNDPAAPFTQN